MFKRDEKVTYLVEHCLSNADLKDNAISSPGVLVATQRVWLAGIIEKLRGWQAATPCVQSMGLWDESRGLDPLSSLVEERWDNVRG